MEAADEVTSNIVKGKRTKRQRVQSPVPLAITDGFVETTDGTEENTGGISVGNLNDSLNAKNSTNVSPSASQEFVQTQESTEEEEEMANCLILLAQGQFKQDTGRIHSIVPSNNGNKFNSRKFMETCGTGGSGKVGYYVYECKTCCRTFPSFQALGGHRASHKKPKGLINNYNYNDEELDVHYKDISSLSLQLSNSNANANANTINVQHNNKAKIHECSICGAEFASGQALGGHMRRHRAPTNTKNLSLTPMVMESNQPKQPTNILSLDLDLNLPAPDADEKQNPLKQQHKSPLVSPGPALVDCHY